MPQISGPEVIELVQIDLHNLRRLANSESVDFGT